MRRTSWIVLLSLLTLLATWVTPAFADGGQSTLIGQSFTLEAGERLEQDLVVFGGTIRLEPESVVAGNVALMGGEAIVAGVIEGDLSVFGGTVELSESALVRGDLVVFGEIRRHPRALVEGNVVEGLEAARSLQNLPRLFSETGRVQLPPAQDRALPRAVSGWGWFGWLMRLVATLTVVLVVAGLVAIVLPDNVGRIVKVSLDAPLLCLGVGVLTSVLVAVLTPLLVVICIGIPVAIVLVLAYLLCGLVGWVAMGKLVGDRLLATAKSKPQWPLADIMVGTLLITAVSQVPCLGALFGFFILSLGIGAVVLSRFGLLSSPFWTPYATAPSAAGSAAQPEPAAPSPVRESDTHRLDGRVVADLEEEEQPAHAADDSADEGGKPDVDASSTNED